MLPCQTTQVHSGTTYIMHFSVIANMLKLTKIEICVLATVYPPMKRVKGKHLSVKNRAIKKSETLQLLVTARRRRATSPWWLWKNASSSMRRARPSHNQSDAAAHGCRCVAQRIHRVHCCRRCSIATASALRAGRHWRQPHLGDVLRFVPW